ncbi:MAG: aminopeptidase P family protein [Rhodospirillales bacterium]|nr:aminopeptidase P family protein [Rhodospirillales bacterium]
MDAQGTLNPLPPIPAEEYKSRVAKMQELLDANRLDAMLVTSEDNYRYLTGFDSPTWVNLTRPRYCVVPRAGEPFLVVPANAAIICERTAPSIADVRTWIAPNPADDGVSIVADGLRSFATKYKRVAAELGAESRMTMPIGDFLRLKDMLAPIEIVDGFKFLLALRMVKSPAEVARIRRIAGIVSDSFDALKGSLRVGQSELEAGQIFKIDMLKRGAHTVPYVCVSSDRGGYRSINVGPCERTFNKGDLLMLDTGSAFEGYYCDFNRNYVFGKPSDELQGFHQLVWDSTEVGLKAVRPGVRMCDVWKAMADYLAANAGKGYLRKKQGRLGHGIGLRMCEPPSFSGIDETVIKAGMTLTLEPSIAFPVPGKDGTEERVVVHEENILVTEKGCELLTRRAPRELPVVN